MLNEKLKAQAENFLLECQIDSQKTDLASIHFLA